MTAGFKKHKKLSDYFKTSLIFSQRVDLNRKHKIIKQGLDDNNNMRVSEYYTKSYQNPLFSKRNKSN